MCSGGKNSVWNKKQKIYTSVLKEKGNKNKNKKDEQADRLSLSLACAQDWSFSTEA